MSRIRAFLELMRPANVVTAYTDVAAGMAIVGFVFGKDMMNQLIPLITLGFSSMALYAGGVVFNDIFDQELDLVERPERALPSGRIKRQEAVFGGIALLALGIFLAFWQSRLSGYLSILITILALFYDAKGKHMPIFGPINMGLCRAINLGLGMSIYELGFLEHGALMLIPLIYIAAITLVSRGEVHGSHSRPLWFAAILFLIVHASQIWAAKSTGHLASGLPFILVHAYLVLSKLAIAIRDPQGPNIGKTVKMGVLTLILMNSAWISLSGQWEMAILVLFLLPISIQLGKKFAVT
jgi:4-hydroxybenzoate polyprenyltransferase